MVAACKKHISTVAFVARLSSWNLLTLTKTIHANFFFEVISYNGLDHATEDSLHEKDPAGGWGNLL